MSIKYGSLSPTVGDAVVGKVERVVEAPVVEEKSESKTVTNWRALAQAGLKPTYIRCDTPQEVSRVNLGCHSALSLDPDQMSRHLDNEHGGSFFVSFREGYHTDPLGASGVKQGRHWDGWARFEELGLEIKDFRCDICNEEIKINSRSILKHIKPHNGKTSRFRPGGDFWLTLTRQYEAEPDDDE